MVSKSKNNTNKDKDKDIDKKVSTISKEKKDSTKSKDIEKTEKQDIVVTNFVSPYITTVLTTTIMLFPRQLDNSIYIHLKDNLIEKLEGKCYRNYGYISKVYQIINYSQGTIVPENPMAGVTFDVKFSCRLCNPLKSTEIICKIEKMKGMMINAINGPITVFISIDERINNQSFYYDQMSNRLIYKKNDKESIEITQGSYIKVIIEQKKFYDANSIIYAMGKLNSIPTEQEIKEHFDEEFGLGSENNIVDFDKYNSEQQTNIVGEKE